ncbi:MAG: hypothetical protein QCI38_01710, partial [Candidatus Thermoplasmatota archaeon]|nr:hypothetical protein [Candidatus Thermoplasmatota archaeon]
MESISAGDMEKYGYCPLSWWLSRDSDISDESTEKGVQRHREMEKKLDRARESLDRSKGFERAVFWSAILATIVSMVGVTMVPQFSRNVGGGENAALSGGYILAFLALVWLLAAAYFLYRVEKMGSAEMRNKAEVIITIFSIVAMLLALYSVTYLIPTTDNQLATLAQALALMWLIGASLFLYKSISLHNRYSGAKKDAGLGKGELEYHDSTKYRPKMLV